MATPPPARGASAGWPRTGYARAGPDQLLGKKATAAGAAVRTVRPSGTITATTDLSISFIRPPTSNRLIAIAEVIHSGKRLYRVEIAIFCNEKMVAKTNATFILIEKLK